MSIVDRAENQFNINFDPVFTKAQVFKAEGEYNTTWGENRRITMMVLTQSGQNLVDNLTSMLAEDETADAYFSMIEQIGEYEQHLKNSIELTLAATARLLLVAQHVADNEAEPTELA
ncbi:hypothetical protein V3O24_03645 [Methylobacter sp. Wu8]|uniref:hypothetical protein n=1 Tax=Methylobacter sp. Wu8 TaxID=3118457 RepID=UPI002F32CB27